MVKTANIQITFSDLPHLRNACELICTQPEASGENDKKKSVLLPVELSGRIARIRRLCREADEEFTDRHMILVKQFGHLLENGQFGIDPGSPEYEEYRKHKKELDAETFTIDRYVKRNELVDEFKRINPIILDGFEPVFEASEEIGEVHDKEEIETSAGTQVR